MVADAEEEPDGVASIYKHFGITEHTDLGVVQVNGRHVYRDIFWIGERQFVSDMFVDELTIEEDLLDRARAKHLIAAFESAKIVMEREKDEREGRVRRQA